MKYKMRPVVRSESGRGRTPAGFTMIELLIAISIFVVLATLIVPAIGYSIGAERVPSAARDIQSMIEGARSRAADAKRARGVRFIVNPNNPRTASGMIYIGAPRKYSGGTIVIDPDLHTLVQTELPNMWFTLFNQGTLVSGSRIKIAGVYYTLSVDTDDDNDGTDDAQNLWVWQLTRDIADPLLADGTTTIKYELDLQPSPLPFEEPVLFPQGIVIDLNNSTLPAGWVTNAGTSGASYNDRTYSNQMDILFSPQGTGIGALTSTSKAGGTSTTSSIQFLLADIVDVAQNRGPLDTAKEGDQRYVNLNPQTGFINSETIVVP